MDTDTATFGRTAQTCPRCGAAARGDVSWCTQCYLDLTPVPTSLSMPAAALVPVDLGKPVDPSGPGAPDPTWPCPCGTANSFEEIACTACGTAFLARLRDDEAPSLLLPLVGDVARFSRNQRLLGACGAALLLSLLFLLVGVLL